MGRSTSAGNDGSSLEPCHIEVACGSRPRFLNPLAFRESATGLRLLLAMSFASALNITSQGELLSVSWAFFMKHARGYVYVIACTYPSQPTQQEIYIRLLERPGLFPAAVENHGAGLSSPPSLFVLRPFSAPLTSDGLAQAPSVGIRHLLAPAPLPLDQDGQELPQVELGPQAFEKDNLGALVHLPQ